MQVRRIFGLWAALLTLAWGITTWLGSAALPADTGALWWQLRRHGLYLTGVWSIGMMSLVMLLALRQPWQDRLLGGMDQVYRLHKWAGIAAGVTAIMHWAIKEFMGDWINDTWGRAGKPARDAVLAWVTDWRGLSKDVGEWAFYALVLLIVLTLWQKLLPYRPWRKLHRVMPVLYLALVFHTVALMPLALWTGPVGALLAVLLVLGSGAALWSLLGRIGRARSYAGRIHSVQLLGSNPERDPLEVVCALPADWPGHAPGQFVFATLEDAEGPHPFTVASAQGACGQAEDGSALLRLVIKPLGDYTRQLHQRLQPGQSIRIEGPYGQFKAQGSEGRKQVWIAGGVGITPFLALLEARQRATAEGPSAPVCMHYCTRDAASDGVLPRVQALAASAQPPIPLQVHDAARKQYLCPEDLLRHQGPLEIWLCGPVGLGDMVRTHARQQNGWRVHQEAFEMR